MLKSLVIRNCKKPILNGCNPKKRLIGTFKVAEEVRDAVSTGKPVVALESTIITHGLPYPDNVNMARDVENLIRSQGVVPATIGFVNGNGMVGIQEEHLEFLGSSTGMYKISRREIPYIMSKKFSGGTTIAATMILAHKAGIDIFATGGLGGVHRGGEHTMDVSADLDELSRTPVGVVCSGPKSILDIGRTLEYLETKGVHVSTYGPDGTNVPGFYTSDSGFPSPYNFQTTEQAAELMVANKTFDLNTGAVFCVPNPKEFEINKQEIDTIINDALTQADKVGTKGKDVTPFLLKKIWEATEGNSLHSNIGLMKNNATIGARIAKHMSEITGVSNKNFQPQPNPLATSSVPEKDGPKKNSAKTDTASANAMVIGTMAVDLTCNLAANQLYTSNPGKVQSTVGGVGHNVALSAQYHGANVKLVTELGSDEGAQVATTLTNLNDHSGFLTSADKRTSRYIAMHDSKGELVIACADMDDSGNMDVDHIRNQIIQTSPKVVFFDGNINTEQMDTVISSSREVGAIIGFEPASVAKAKKLARLSPNRLGVYKNNPIDVITPNQYELSGLFESFRQADMFDSDNWFSIIDDLNLNQDFRYMIENFAQANPDLKNEFLNSGTVQQAIHLLPYIPTIVVKNGKRGVLLFQLVTKSTQSASQPSVGKLWIGKRGQYNILIQHFPAYTVPDSNVVSVTGAGDTFCGVLLAELAKDPAWLYDSGYLKERVINAAQKSASETIQSSEAVANYGNNAKQQQ